MPAAPAAVTCKDSSSERAGAADLGEQRVTHKLQRKQSESELFEKSRTMVRGRDGPEATPPAGKAGRRSLLARERARMRQPLQAKR
jgi:hypothetical protein